MVTIQWRPFYPCRPRQRGRASEGWSGARRLQSVALASAALAGTLYCILLAWKPPEPVPQAFVFDPSASWITTGAAKQSTGVFALSFRFQAKSSMRGLR